MHDLGINETPALCFLTDNEMLTSARYVSRVNLNDIQRKLCILAHCVPLCNHNALISWVNRPWLAGCIKTKQWLIGFWSTATTRLFGAPHILTHVFLFFSEHLECNVGDWFQCSGPRGGCCLRSCSSSAFMPWHWAWQLMPLIPPPLLYSNHPRSFSRD